MSYSGSVGRQTIGSLGSSEDSTTGSLKKPTFSERHPKAIRSITVIGYLFCVSLAAILLSAYYVVFWEPSAKDPQKSSMLGNTTSQCPCRDAGTYVPTENGGGTYLHPYKRFAPNKRMKTPFLVYVGSPSRAAQQPAPIPEPSKLVSPSKEELANTSNNTLHHQNNSTFSHASVHDSNDILPSSATFTISEKHEEFQTATSESVEYDMAESTLVTKPPSPSTNSIIIQKLLQSSKSVIQQQKEYT